MKILILTDLTYPSDHSFLEEVYTKRLYERGHTITWIMRQENNNSNGKIGSWNNTKVHLINSKGFNSIGSAIMTSIYTIKEINLIIDELDWDIIQVRNDPLMGLIASKKAKKFNRPFVYQYTFYKGKGILNKNKSKFVDKLKGYLGNKLEYEVLKSANLVLTISKTMSKELIHQGYSENKLYPCPLGVDERVNLDKVNINLIKKRYQLKEEVIIYLGTLSSERNLEFLINVFEKVKSIRKEAQLLLVGDSKIPEDVSNLKNYVLHKGFTNNDVIFTGRVPRKDIYNYIAASNVCVSPIPPSPIYKIASPIKLMDYLNAGKPVVGNTGIVEQEEILGESGGGYCVNYNVDEFVDALIKILSDEELAIRMGQRGREYIRKYRGYTNITNNLEIIYKQLIYQ